MRRTARVAVAALSLAGAATAGAQTDAPVESCHGQRVTAIRITSEAPSVAGFQHVPVLSDISRTVHVTTQPNVIERFLLLHVGDRCDERRRAESERVLRAQPFIADVSIRTLSDGQGGVLLDVLTVDEVAAVFSTTVRRRAPLFTALQLGDANWGGEGVSAIGSWWHEDALRDGLAMRATDYQFAGEPWQATGAVERDPLGGLWHADVQRPFFTDLQRMAWRVQGGEEADYVRFVDASGLLHANRLTRDYADVGGLGRIGPPGRLGLIGLSLSHESEQPGTQPVQISDSGTTPDPGSLLAFRYPSRSVSRINALLGYRNLKYLRTTGMDGLNNVQDIPIGLQLGALVGRSTSLLGSAAHDMLVGGDVYVGRAEPDWSLRLQAIGEGRHDLSTNAWDGLLGSGRAAAYRRLSGSQMLISSLEWSGGWHVRVPFQVTLAGTDGGIRGMPEAVEQGGRRAIMRVEDRWTLRSPFDATADLGFAIFGDAGRLWAGDTPWGTTTPIRYSGGVSLLAAIPSRSARLWRLDLALPSVPGRRLQLALRISHSTEASVFWREPRDVARARDRSVPESLFNWP